MNDTEIESMKAELARLTTCRIYCIEHHGVSPNSEVVVTLQPTPDALDEQLEDVVHRVNIGAYLGEGGEEQAVADIKAIVRDQVLEALSSIRKPSKMTNDKALSFHGWIDDEPRAYNMALDEYQMSVAKVKSQWEEKGKK